jgi:hypothetical protein
VSSITASASIRRLASLCASAQQLDLATTGQQTGAFAHRPIRTHVQRPEGLPQRSDLNERGARHQLLAEDTDVAPALQRPRTAVELVRWRNARVP